MELHQDATAAGVRLLIRDTVASTNAEALALARTGVRGPLWVTAHSQTAGRGRRGRTWLSRPGNLHATLLLTDTGAPGRAPEFCFVAALAVHDAVAEVAPSLDARLKWPNDVLVGGAKLAGVLVEGETVAHTGMAVAIGIGLNCTWHPEGTPHRASDLRALGAAVAPSEALRALSASVLRRLWQWDQGRGFAAIRQDWLARAAGIGEPIRVRTPEYELEGIFTALDQLGRLVLAAADGSTQTIGAGEVFFPARPTLRDGMLA